MPEELLRQILDEVRNQHTPAWLEALKLIVPPMVGLVGGLFAAGVGIYAARNSGTTQLKVLETSVSAQKEAENATRRAAWRRERYTELQNALAEYLGALRRLSVAGINLASGSAGSAPQELRSLLQTELSAAATNMRQINVSSRVFQAVVKIDDESVANTAQEIVLSLTAAQGGAIGSAGDSRRLDELSKLQDEAFKKIFDLNRK